MHVEVDALDHVQVGARDAVEVRAVVIDDPRAR